MISVSRLCPEGESIPFEALKLRREHNIVSISRLIRFVFLEGVRAVLITVSFPQNKYLGVNLIPKQFEDEDTAIIDWIWEHPGLTG